MAHHKLRTAAKSVIIDKGVLDSISMVGEVWAKNHQPVQRFQTRDGLGNCRRNIASVGMDIIRKFAGRRLYSVTTS